MTDNDIGKAGEYMAISALTRLSPRYTVGDLIKSTTAEQKGISNLPPDSMLDTLTKMANLLEKIEAKYGSVRIASGYRGPELNKAVGGASGSKHQEGSAIDIVPLSPLMSQQYWLNLISDVELMSLMGEVSWKTHQNAIHITLPYGLTKGSARVTDDGISYYRIETDPAKSILARFGIGDLSASTMGVGIGLGIFILSAGAFILAMALKRKN